MDSTKLKNFFARYWILIVLVAVKLILQFVLVNPVYELHRDEFLHLNQADHLAFGFISVPPFTSVVSKIIFLFGGSLFWIRFFPALFGALTVVVAWLIVESLGGKLFSKVLVSCALVFSVLVRLNILFQPNSFDILAWTTVFWLMIRYVQTDHSKWLYFLSVAVAIGFYNKYNLAFLMIGLVAGLLLTTQRKQFAKVPVWKAIFLIFLLILPNLIWQLANHFPVLHHMRVLKENQLDNNSYSGFVRGQIMFFFGSIPLTICAFLAFIRFKPFRIYRFIGLAVFAVLVLFTILKAKDYYAIGLYPVLFAFGSVYLESILSRKRKFIMIPLLISLNLLVFVFIIKTVFPVLTPPEIRANSAAFEKLGMLRWEDGKNHQLPQDFADMLGWKEMAGKALAAYEMLPKNELKNTLVFCDNYGQTGAVNYYNRGKMPEAYSFNTDYIYWLPYQSQVRNILLVGQKPSQKVIDMFAEIKLIGAVENEFAREKGTSIYLLTGGNDEVSGMINKLAEERKAKFDIF